MDKNNKNDLLPLDQYRTTMSVKFSAHKSSILKRAIQTSAVTIEINQEVSPCAHTDRGLGMYDSSNFNFSGHS